TKDSKAAADVRDWPMYNHDVLGTRFNPGETAIDRSNAGRLEMKWRFPAQGSELDIGVIHATPIVVGGCVYFGTTTDPAFYKLTPDGKVCWSYRNPALAQRNSRAADAPKDKSARVARFQSGSDGVLGSALVSGETVFFGDLAGWFYALDTATGAERWKLSARGDGFPGAHPINVF